jgi:hypothetical protein
MAIINVFWKQVFCFWYDLQAIFEKWPKTSNLISSIRIAPTKTC